MKDFYLNIYHHLPRFVRDSLASMYGYRLRSWRYGAETDLLVRQAIEREQWSPEKWRAWQEERLAYVLHRAATKVPYYRSNWEIRRRKGDSSSWSYLENWPLLDKESVRTNPEAFVAEDCDRKKMYLDQTGGTTGTPLKLWLKRETLRAWHAAFEARARMWNGTTRYENWATLGGQAVVHGNAKKPPFWVWNRPMRHLYMSANHVSGENTAAYIDALKRYGIQHILAYPTSLAFLATEALKQKLATPRLKVILTMAESFSPQQRSVLETAFECPVRETYGMGELVAMSTECQAGNLHLWPEVGWVEVLSDDDDQRIGNGGSGRLVCTSLVNADMPLIRYLVGDRGSLRSELRQCSCGRTLPVISKVEGRTSDLLVTRDGRRVYWLNPVFYDLPIVEAQIVQETVDFVKIKYVPDNSFTPDHRTIMTTRLKARMGELKVVAEPVEKIERAENGKFRPVVCNVA